MDPRLGRKLAEGACADVHLWGEGEDRIVKVAKPNTNLFALQRELRHCRIAFDLGLPVPKPFGLIETDGRNGIVFARATGRSILQLFMAEVSEPEDDCLRARLTARMLHRIHAETAEGLPAQQTSIERNIRRSEYLSDAEKDGVMALLLALPQRHQLCHGDPNPGNLLLSGDAVTVIDWNDATIGNPEADLAEYVLMLRHAQLPAGAPADVARLFEANRQPAIGLFVDEYERLSGTGMAQIVQWLAPIAARKLGNDGVTEVERRGLLDEVHRGLAQA